MVPSSTWRRRRGFEGRGGFGAYTASKFGVRGLTADGGPSSSGRSAWRVNCVVPGPIRTAMTERKGWDEADYAKAYGGYPLGRRGEPEEVAKVTLFLASDDSSYCTGTDFVADGGVLAGKPVDRLIPLRLHRQGGHRDRCEPGDRACAGPRLRGGRRGGRVRGPHARCV